MYAIRSYYDQLPEAEMDKLAEVWNSSDRILILVGSRKPNEELNELLCKASSMDNVVVLTETTSNLKGECMFTGIDKVISTITEEEIHFYKPKLLITIDGSVVSKKVKTFLRDYPAKLHWHISSVNHHLDTYKQLSTAIESDALMFFKQLMPKIDNVKSRFKLTWKNNFDRATKNHGEYLAKSPWSDLKVFEVLANEIPRNYLVQWGNSSVV